MKTIRIAAFLAILLGAVADAQTAPAWVTVTSVVTWNPVALDVQGNPETILGYEVALTAPAVDLVALPTSTVLARATVTTGVETSLTALTTAKAPGAYRLFVRAQDAALNWSGWSAPLDVSLDFVAPAIPTGLKIKVIVTVP